VNRLDALHERYVTGRRARVLAARLADVVPHASTVLDVGSGDGRVAADLLRRRPDLHIEGLEVQVRSDARLAAGAFDGRSIPRADCSHDVALYVDVLHHATEPLELLLDGCRVARRAVIIKDHLREGWLAARTLRFMDRVGNERHGVPSPAVYWSHAEWLDAFAKTGWTVNHWQTRLHLYPAPASWIFERSLHFIARLEPPGPATGAHL
jgi:SAM-dependent methyltransferase